MLNVESLRTWEFNSSFPIRSIVPVYLVSGPAMVLLRCLRSAGFQNIISSYTILVMPRLAMLFLSFLIDLCVFRVVEVLGGNGKAGVVLVASSYVTIVYYTRTFSNSFEGILFAVLLIETLTVKSSQSSAVESKDGKQKSHRDSVMVRGSGIRVALVIVLGLFNRPTFAAYAAVPFIYWVFKRNATDRQLYADQVLSKTLGTLLAAVFFTAFFTICDSVYFGSLLPVPGEIISALQDVGFCDFFLKNLTVTPLNFLLYNAQFNNLASHGIHPMYLHVVINVQILFCMLGIFAAKDVIRLMTNVFRNGTVAVNSLASVVLLSYAVPLLLLSFFPHQEPRFLIPLLCPLAVLGTAEIFGSKSKRYITISWVIFNVFALAFFGFAHQGGVIRAISRLRHDAVGAEHPQATTDAVFWRTYMPPRHLFLSRKHRFPAERGYRVHDLAGASTERLSEFLISFRNSSKHGSLLLISPGSLQHKVQCLHDSFELQVMDRFWPHFSGEDLPTADLILCRENAQSKSNVNCQSQCLLERIYSAFSLYLYRINWKAKD